MREEKTLDLSFFKHIECTEECAIWFGESSYREGVKKAKIYVHYTIILPKLSCTVLPVPLPWFTFCIIIYTIWIP